MILAALVALAAGAWLLLFWQWRIGDGDMSLTMGMGAPLFLAIWILMMVAMMFPTASPMILMFNRVQAQKQARGQRYVPASLFTGAYLALWIAFGVTAYAAAVGGERIAHESSWLMDNAARIGGGVLIAAGIYQLSPLKRACLSKCRSPLSFVMHSWRDGRLGAVRMGFEHGMYCVGCCWLLFVILFPLGVMNVAIMALITLLIFAEKSAPFGRQVAAVAAVALIAYGALVLALPDTLPTMIDMDSNASMDEMARGTGLDVYS